MEENHQVVEDGLEDRQFRTNEYSLYGLRCGFTGFDGLLPNEEMDLLVQMHSYVVERELRLSACGKTMGKSDSWLEKHGATAIDFRTVYTPVTVRQGLRTMD